MKTRIHPLLLIVVLLLSNISRSMAQQNVSTSPEIQISYSGGSGTVGDPYQIANLTDLRYLSEHSADWSKYFKQTADIDATSTNTWNVGNHDNDAGTATVAMGFSPIGNSTTNFTGKYDGQNHTISGLYINRMAAEYIGMFGYVNTGCVITNLGLIDVSISGLASVGGLVGFAYAGSISNTYTKGSIVFDARTNSNAQSGGLVGIAFLACTISDSYSEASVSGTKSFVGGLVGINYGTITKCYATGNVSGLGSFRGGLVGENGGITNGGIIRESYATGTVNGNTSSGENFGGLVGRNNDGKIYNSYATGNVTGYNYVGGLVGYILASTSSIFNSYATGAVSSSTTNKGGLIGANTYGATLTNCYWDTQTSGIVTSRGGIGKTTAEMKTLSTFTNWSFTDGSGTWQIKLPPSGFVSYPYLRTLTYDDLNATVVVNPIPGLTAFTYFSGGAGTDIDPYKIATLSDLRFLSENTDMWNKYFIQTADIVATATNTWNVGDHDDDTGTATVAMGFSPIGNGTTYFSGKYDGQNHTISGLYINRQSSDVIGFFGNVNTSLGISNLGLTNINITGRICVGGLIGYAAKGTFSNVYTTGTLVSKPGGSSNNAILGGLIGNTNRLCTTSSSYSSVNVTTSGTELREIAAGLIGRNDGTINNCYATGNVGGNCSFIGGLVGENEGSISQSYATGNVNGSTTAGEYFGGLVGRNYHANISNCYATGRVTGYSYVGGLVGYFSVHDVDYSIINSYAKGTISGTTSFKGGLIGDNYHGTITNCFWDTQTSGIATSNGGTGKTTAQLKTQATFTDWDFTTTPVWDMAANKNNGYPYLAWQNPSVLSGGSGSLSNPYQIATLADLRFLSENSSYWASGKYFIQTADIDATETNTWNVENHDGDAGTANVAMGFKCIGTATAGSFNGVYDGQGHTISNLYINRPSANYIGLFGYINATTAIISNLGLTNVNVSGSDRVGGLVGWNNTGLITKSFTTGVVKGLSTVGGLVGLSNYGKIFYSFSSASTEGSNGVGGLNGQTWEGTVSNSYAIGSVKGDVHVGGLIGYFGGFAASVVNSYAVGVVAGNSGSTNVGGLVGTNDAGKPGTATNSFWDYQTTGQTTSIIGISKSTVEMKAQATFTGWDFVTTPDWKITSNKNNGNPYLAWQNLPIDVPAVQASELVFSAVHNYDMTIGWTNGNGESRAVFVKEGTGAISNPVNQTTYTASSDWATPGTQLGSSGYYCVYKGTGNSVTVTNLSKNTEYSVQVFEFNGAFGSEVYKTSTGVDNPKNQATANESGTAVDMNNAIRLKAYPNPVSDAFRIEGLSGVSSITISDLSGRIMLEKQVSDNEAIQIAALPMGVYIVKIVNNNEKKELKLVKGN